MGHKNKTQDKLADPADNVFCIMLVLCIIVACILGSLLDNASGLTSPDVRGQAASSPGRWTISGLTSPDARGQAASSLGR